MSAITFQGNPVPTGTLPAVASKATGFTLTGTDLSDKGLGDFAGQTVVLNIFPSIDTPVCAATVRRFNQEAAALDNTVVLCVSADLPFAHQRFCEVEGLEDVIPLSTFRSPDFGDDYGVAITDGPLRGLLSRAIVIIAPDGTVRYTEHVPDITEAPDYQAALDAIAA